jgi:hypothetical protein
MCVIRYALQASSLADNSNLLGSTDSSIGSSSSSSIDDDEAAEAAEDRYEQVKWWRNDWFIRANS